MPYTYNPQVAQQQAELNKKGANLKVDGFLGPLTQAAINQFGGQSATPTQGTPQNQVLTQGQSFTDPAGRTGIVNFNSDTGERLAPGATTNSIGKQLNALSNSSSTNTSNTRTSSTNQPRGIDVSDLEEQYKALFGPSKEEKSLKNQQEFLDEQMRGFNRSAEQMNLNVGNQPIARGFISGQQRALAEQSAIDRRGITDQQQTLQQKLANAQARRQSSIDAIRFSLDRADKETTRQDSLKAQQADETYRNAVLNKKETSSDAGFTLNEGDRRFDAQGNLIASGGPKTYAPSSGTDYTKTERKAYEALASEIPSYPDKKTALEDLAANKSTIIKDIGQKGYDQLIKDINSHFGAMNSSSNFGTAPALNLQQAIKSGGLTF